MPGAAAAAAAPASALRRGLEASLALPAFCMG